MRVIQRTWALYIPCCLLVALHGRALADEEALWGPPESEERPVEEPRSYWWTPSLPKFPSLPSVSFPFNPWGGKPESKDEGAGFSTTTEGLTKPTDRSPQHSGSGEESDPVTVEPPATYTQFHTTRLLASVTPVKPELLTGGPPAYTREVPARNDSDAIVSDSPRGTFTEGMPSSLLNATHTRLPKGTVATTERGTAPADPRLSAASSTVVPETTVPTAPIWTPPRTATINPGPVETTLSRHPLGSMTPPASHVAVAVTTSKEITGGPTRETTVADVGLSRTPGDDHGFGIATEMKGGAASKSTTRTPIVEVNSQIPADEEDMVDPLAADQTKETSSADISTASSRLPSSSDSLTTEGPARTSHIPLYTEDWTSNLPANAGATFLPDCNKESSGICNPSDPWEPTTSSNVPLQVHNTTTINQSHNPFLFLTPPMLVPLYADWNSALATWGIAWEAHIYGIGCLFAGVTLASALNLLCLPLRCPSGCGYFALVSLFLLAASSTRSFSLLYDAYGHQGRLPTTEASLMLCEALFPCLTAAFGLVFLLLSMRSRMQLSYSAFQRPFFLACLVVLHFAAAFGPVTLLKLYQQKPSVCLFLALVSRGSFVVLATFLSAAYFVFYIYVRADSKHIYHLNNTSPTPAERYNRCPFAESRDWERAAMTVCLSALFSLACAGLQLYAMLNAMGITGGEEVFHPWPWWMFQLSSRVCELGVCLTLALVVAQPVHCSNRLPGAGSCWTELLATKSPILPGSYQWTLGQQEKLAIVDTGLGLGETESLPLYTLVDDRFGSSLNGLDLLYHSNRALAYRDLDLDLDLQSSEKPKNGLDGATSGGSSLTSDSTADLRPPSPINLRRSIDEALFSEALFPMGLFSPSRCLRCSDLSLDNLSGLPNSGQALQQDPGLYRTASCVEMVSEPPPSQLQPRGDVITGASPTPSLTTSTCRSSPERWRGSTSSCSLYRPSLGGSSPALCPGTERQAQCHVQDDSLVRTAPSGLQRTTDSQRPYQTLGSTSQESLELDMTPEADRSVQDEFISVCRQIDALSICSETIDL